jgi:hypothetical protein
VRFKATIALMISPALIALPARAAERSPSEQECKETSVPVTSEAAIAKMTSAQRAQLRAKLEMIEETLRRCLKNEVDSVIEKSKEKQ